MIIDNYNKTSIIEHEKQYYKYTVALKSYLEMDYSNNDVSVQHIILQ